MLQTPTHLAALSHLDDLRRSAAQYRLPVSARVADDRPRPRLRLASRLRERQARPCPQVVTEQ